MIGTLKIYAHFQRDGNDTDTVIAELVRVNVVSDAPDWTAVNETGDVVASMQTFDDDPVSVTDTAIEIEGILVKPQGQPTEHGDHFGHWELTP